MYNPYHSKSLITCITCIVLMCKEYLTCKCLRNIGRKERQKEGRHLFNNSDKRESLFDLNNSIGYTIKERM